MEEYEMSEELETVISETEMEPEAPEELETPPSTEIINDEEVVTTEAPEETELLTVVLKDCLRLNVRSKPDIQSEVVCIVGANSEMVVKGSANGWTRVYVGSGENTKRGYVMTKYIEER